MRKYSRYSSIDDATVAKIERICPGIHLVSVNKSLWGWREEGKSPAIAPPRLRNKAMYDVIQAAEKLRKALARLDQFAFESEFLRHSLGRDMYESLPRHLDEVKALAPVLAEWRERDHRKALSPLSLLIINVGFAVLDAGGIVDARRNGQVARIVGILAETIDKADPDRTTVRDALKSVGYNGLKGWRSWDDLFLWRDGG